MKRIKEHTTRTRITFAVALSLLVGAGSCQALLSSRAAPDPVGIYSVFGPETFLRQPNKPQSETHNFPAQPGNNYVLRIFNGGRNGEFERASSAQVLLNQESILGQSEFNQQAQLIERQVRLEANNLLSVKVLSSGRSGLTVEIFGFDYDAPSINASVVPSPNSLGWNNNNLTVSFNCSDALSGIATCPSPVTVTNETTSQVISGTAIDRAGNSANTSITVRIDKTRPEIIAIPNQLPNASGWNRSDVLVTFDCADALSGVAQCSAPLVVTAEGADQVLTGTVSDHAGNSRGVSLRLNIDKTAPVITINSPADNTTLNVSAVNLAGNVSDEISGLASVRCNGVAATLSDLGFSCSPDLVVGFNTINVRAIDNAGNETVSTLHVTFNEPPPIGNYVPPCYNQGCRLLDGPATSLAVEAIRDFDAGDAAASNEISNMLDNRRLARTLLEVAFRGNATVSEVNEVLASVQGGIVSSITNVVRPTIRIPDPGSVQALEQVAETLRSKPSVGKVLLGWIPSNNARPSNITDSDLGTIRHHLSVGGASLWNAKNLLSRTQRPIFVMNDLFGGGVPGALYSGTYVPTDFTATTNPETHGYGVLSILAATYEGDSSIEGKITGLDPSPGMIRVVDGRRPNGDFITSQIDDALVRLIKNAGGPVVVSSSQLFFACTSSLLCNSDYAAAWVHRLNTNGLVDTFVHVVGAGNDPGYDARYLSQYAGAQNLPGLEDPDGNPLPNTSTTLIAEARIGLSDQPGCLTNFSSKPGNISGIGFLIPIIASPSGSLSLEGGTSFSAPQVAAVAEMVWALQPNLTANELKQLLIDTANSEPVNVIAGCSQTPPAPAIDAYAAILATDSNGDPKVRKDILDVNSDRRFDDLDIERILQEFDQNPTAKQSRYDLNGDSKISTADTGRRFDLDMSAPQQAGAVMQRIEQLDVEFQESNVKDLDVLCYYSYSPLFEGDQDRRRTLLIDTHKCPQLKLTVNVDGDYCEGSQLFVSVVSEIERQGFIIPRRNDLVEVEVDPAAGQLNPTNGRTDHLGRFNTLLMSGSLTQFDLRVLVTGPDGANGRKTVRVSKGTACPTTTHSFTWDHQATLDHSTDSVTGVKRLFLNDTGLTRMEIRINGSHSDTYVNSQSTRVLTVVREGTPSCAWRFTGFTEFQSISTYPVQFGLPPEVTGYLTPEDRCLAQFDTSWLARQGGDCWFGEKHWSFPGVIHPHNHQYLDYDVFGNVIGSLTVNDTHSCAGDCQPRIYSWVYPFEESIANCPADEGLPYLAGAGAGPWF